MKTLNVIDANDAEAKIKEIETFGDKDAWKLLCKVSSVYESWMKSTKAMEIPGIGCLVQVSTHQVNPDRSHSVAEAVTFVPGVKIAELGSDKLGRCLVPIEDTEPVKKGKKKE